MRQELPSVGQIFHRRMSRRIAGQTLVTLGALATIGGVALQNAPYTTAQDDHDDSGHGRGRGRGRGRGGDDDSDGEQIDADSAARQSVTGEVPAGAIEIRIISDDAGGFAPAELVIDAGQSIAFVNAHDDEHTATGSGFDTGVIEPGTIATVSIESPGDYFYACQFHPEMTGTIRVRDETGAIPQQAEESVPAAGQTISVVDLTFSPELVTVVQGETIVWENVDTVPHTITSTDGTFDSGIFDPGASYSWTADRAGSFDYICQLHPQMQGTVVVQGSSEAPALEPAQASPEAAPSQSSASREDPSPLGGPWMMELIPGDAASLEPSRALLTFHPDGTVSADFVPDGSSDAPVSLRGPGQGSWDALDGQVRLALAILVTDDSGAYVGSMTVDGLLLPTSDLAALEGDVTINGISPDGDPFAEEGAFRGLRVPLLQSGSG